MDDNERKAPHARVQEIQSRRRGPAVDRTEDLKTITARLSVTAAALSRLLSVTGTQSDFVLASVDGSTTIRVALAVSSVPDAHLVLGESGVTLDWSRSTISHGDNRVSLTRMELRVLLALLEHAPGVATREQLVARLWPLDAARPPRDASLPVWILALRRRFAAIGVTDAIRTVRATGYRLRV